MRTALAADDGDADLKIAVTLDNLNLTGASIWRLSTETEEN
jgi:hypothetical protein